MTKEAYYGKYLHCLEYIMERLLGIISRYPKADAAKDLQPILYCKSRIKEPDSMVKKLQQYHLPVDSATAVTQMHDAVGVRIVCSFLSDVTAVADWLRKQPDYSIMVEKDYVAFPKPNGYRSLHLIVRLKDEQAQGISAEIQIRTIALDFWAALEHQMKYKRNIPHEDVIRSELKRCADEIASIDMSMQTLRELIGEDHWT